MDRQEDEAPEQDTTSPQDIGVTEARAGQRVGLIWVLLISLALATGGLLGYSTLNSRHMSTASNGSGSNQTSPIPAQDFKAPQSEPVTGAAQGSPPAR